MSERKFNENPAKGVEFPACLGVSHLYHACHHEKHKRKKKGCKVNLYYKVNNRLTRLVPQLFFFSLSKSHVTPLTTLIYWLSPNVLTFSIFMHGRYTAINNSLKNDSVSCHIMSALPIEEKKNEEKIAFTIMSGRSRGCVVQFSRYVSMTAPIGVTLGSQCRITCSG